MSNNYAIVAVVCLGLSVAGAPAAESWPQLKFDSRHSGNVAHRQLDTPLGLIGAVPLSDAVMTSPVVADGRVYVVDGSGTAFCIDCESLRVVWKFKTRGGPANCNNVSSPAIAGSYLHFGTTAGSYYVLDRAGGKVIKEIHCGEPIFSAPVVGSGRVYFSTLGSQVYALEPDGTICWTWDYVKEHLHFNGNRWSGEEWARHKGQRVRWGDLFTCSANLALYNETLVVPTGGLITWLKDAGDRAEFLAADMEGRKEEGNYFATRATFGLSIGDEGEVYRQTHRLDNGGQVSILRLDGGKITKDRVPGTRTGTSSGLLSFCSVSLRDGDVYRCRPEEGFALARHSPGQEAPESLGGFPSIASPVLLRDSAVFGALDGQLNVVPLSGDGEVWSYKTGQGKPITAPVAIADGRVYFGCEDGYLYVLGPDGKAPAPKKDLRLWSIRNPLSGKYQDAEFDRYASFGNFGNTNANDQGVAPPFKVKWIRRYKGTSKHFSTCGGGRLYTHTGEGMVFAVEQESGRLLWRRYWPGVYLSYTGPTYFNERLLVPQAGPDKCRLRCLDAATGKLIWEAPFAGSPNWNRQAGPVVCDNLVVYPFSTGKFGRRRTSDTMSWLNSYGQPSYPANHKPLLRAWNLETGKEVWTKDFSEYGSGGDEAGVVAMDDVLYYSCFFGSQAKRRGKPGPQGVTAAIEPASGKIKWLTTEHHLRGGCTISAQAGRLYLGGTDRDAVTKQCHVWCLDATDGSVVWQSEPINRAIKVVTVCDRFCFTHAQKKRSYLIDKENGKILADPTGYYKCTPFTISGQYLFGVNMDIYDLSQESRLVSTGPAMDTCECVSAIVSNGRIFYTAHGFGMQVSQVCGDEVKSAAAVWER